MRFTDKVVLLCGAGHGIGRATAARLADEGARLALLDYDAEALARVAGTIGGQAFYCDLREAASVREAVAGVVSHFGRIDVLVNVAGGAVETPKPLSEEDWDANVSLNLRGPVRLVQAALPHLCQSQGNAVLVASMNGLQAFGGYAYSSAKAGLPILAKNLAADYGKQNVRFNVVAPGSVSTRAWDWSENAADVMLPTIALPRAGQPEDVAAAIAFLASDDAAWITGVTLPVDGGQGAGPQVVINFQQGRE